MTPEESKLIQMLKNGSTSFKQAAASVFKDLSGASAGDAGFSATRIITGGANEATRDLNRVFETRIELFKSVGEASIQAAAGYTRLEEVSKSLFGSTQQAAEAQRALAQEMRTFAFLSTEMQENLGTATMLLEKFGVNMNETGQILDSAAMAFGMSQTELTGLATELATVVYRFPGQASEIARNFKNAQSSLAYDSGKIMTVFKQLQNVSSTTGVSFSTLTSQFGESMDTFEGSATKAGSLNAILGRSVFNSIDLLGKTEAERVNTIVKGVRSSIGGDVNRLGKFQLKAVAEGMGLTVEETRRLLSGQTTVDDVVKGKEASDPKTRLQQQANKAMKEQTMSMEELTTEFKLFRSPLLNMTREIENASRGFAMNKIEKLLQEAAIKSGMAEEDARKLVVASYSEGLEKIINISAGVVPLGDGTNYQDRAFGIRRGMGAGTVAEEEAIKKAGQEIVNRLQKLKLPIPQALLDKFPSLKVVNKTGGKIDPEKGGSGKDDSGGNDSGGGGFIEGASKIGKAIGDALGITEGQPLKIHLSGFDKDFATGVVKKANQ